MNIRVPVAYSLPLAILNKKSIQMHIVRNEWHKLGNNTAANSLKINFCFAGTVFNVLIYWKVFVDYVWLILLLNK